MLETLSVHGFRTLFHTDITFNPLTIVIGKNGVGKTTILNVIQLLGKFARGGSERAFGPPPWSLGWQRTKGIGRVTTVDFSLVLRGANGVQYRYDLKLDERDDRVKVEEERLTRVSDQTVIASYEWGFMPASGTILRPDGPEPPDQSITEASSLLRAFESYELNPTSIEKGNDPKHMYVGRDGYGVAGFLANLKDNDPARFSQIESQLKKFRPETESLDVWSPSEDVYWGIKDVGHRYPFPAVHLSWGDRQLVGMLCILFSAPERSTIALEEIDRGFHPSRYEAVIELLKQAAYDGLAGRQRIQIIITTHSPSFVNKLQDLTKEIRLVTRAPRGATVVRPFVDVLREKLGTEEIEQPIGEVWEMGLLETAISDALT